MSAGENRAQCAARAGHCGGVNVWSATLAWFYSALVTLTVLTEDLSVYCVRGKISWELQGKSSAPVFVMAITLLRWGLSIMKMVFMFMTGGTSLSLLGNFPGGSIDQMKHVLLKTS
jgi:hypothetical protein